jgi:SAM-dependent methyltransferase
MFLDKYETTHMSNRMSHEGDLVYSRTEFMKGKNKNLKVLLHERFNWINNHIQPEQIGLELGAGIAASKGIIKSTNFYTSDFNDSEWLDYPWIDALDTKLATESFDYIVASNMVHHIARPHDFFLECDRILKPGGKLFIQEINTSILMRLVLKTMRHEGFNETIDPFDRNIVCNDPRDAWSANCSIPKLLFRDSTVFEEKYPNWRVTEIKNKEFFLFLNSGGVVAKTIYLPLPIRVLNALLKLDKILCAISPKFFSLQMSIILEKIN